MTPAQYQLHLVLNYLTPAIIAFIAAIVIPRKYMKHVVITAFLITVVWFGIIHPIKLTITTIALYNSTPVTVQQVIQGNVPPTQPIDYMTVLKDPRFQVSALKTLALSFANSVFKALTAVFAMAVVFGVKSLFAKPKEEDIEEA